MSASSAPEIVSKSCIVLNLWNKTDFLKYPPTDIYIIASGKWAGFVCVLGWFFVVGMFLFFVYYFSIIILSFLV